MKTSIVMTLLFMSMLLLMTVDLCSQPLTHNYLPNPGVGLMTEDTKALDLMANHYQVSTVFAAIYLSEVLTDEFINDDGSVDIARFYPVFCRYADGKFHFFRKPYRYVLRVFPSINASSPTFYTYTVNSNITHDSLVLIGYPKKIYDMLVKSNYPPTYVYRDDADRFKKTKNFSVMDFREPIVYNIYETLLQCLEKYLKEDSGKKDIYGNVVTKGDFISFIEMGFVGPWGEGNAAAYEGHCDYASLVGVAELYKKYLFNYLLVAPSYGMRKVNAPNDDIERFQYYLATTTYGSTKKNRFGQYYGNKEFGLFIDHLGTLDTQRDFTLTGYGDLKTIAHNKYKKAPVIGENCGRYEWESDKILGNIEEYGVSVLKPWGKLDELSDEGSLRWRLATSEMGYHLKVIDSSIETRLFQKLIKFSIVNEGVAPCYDAFWCPILTIRSKIDGNVRFEICLKKKDTFREFGVTTKTVKIKTPFLSHYERKHFTELYDVCFSVIDTKCISPNMYLDNDERTNNGEYLLF